PFQQHKKTLYVFIQFFSDRIRSAAFHLLSTQFIILTVPSIWNSATRPHSHRSFTRIACRRDVSLFFTFDFVGGPTSRDYCYSTTSGRQKCCDLPSNTKRNLKCERKYNEHFYVSIGIG
ncbi:unnamed protein product, partial [Amoebophrya sp. A120]